MNVPQPLAAPGRRRFVAVRPRNGTITIPAEGRRALRLDLPGAQVEVILRDRDLVPRPHVAVPLERVRDDGTAPGPRQPVTIRCRGPRLTGVQRAPPGESARRITRSATWSGMPGPSRRCSHGTWTGSQIVRPICACGTCRAGTGTCYAPAG